VSKRELNIFKLLSQKPWESSQATIDNVHDGKTLGLSKANLGVRTIMVVSTVIFSLFVVSYSDRMLVHDWKSLSEPWLLWINTVILIFTSIVFHKTKVLSDQTKFEKAKNGLLRVMRRHRENTRVKYLKVLRMVRVLTTGLMSTGMKANGSTVCSMDREPTTRIPVELKW